MKTFKFALILAVSLMVCISSVFASNITIYDNRKDGNNNGTNWYNRGTNPGEDQEVEPGMIYNQSWDLEGFFLDDNILSMVGGFNFKDGNSGYTSGDIFIDIDGDATYGVSGNSLRNGYDYAIDLVFGGGIQNPTYTYKVYAITTPAKLVDVLSYNSFESSPWSYNAGTQAVFASGNFDYSTGLTNAQTGFLGGTHYAITGIDLSFLPGATTFTSHFTMQCGNDNLMGKGTTVPEPGSLLLLGLGLLGLGVSSRKLRK
jgi:hypothetical protein